MTKQEQIENMIDAMTVSNDPFVDVPLEIMPQIAEALYNAGYQKIDDKCAVITKDELNLYKKQAVKDTAKEICDLILEHWEKKQLVECDWLRVKIAEKYGVDMK